MPRNSNIFFRIFCWLGFILLFSGFSSEKTYRNYANIPVSDQDKGVIVVVYDGDTVGIEFPDGQRRKIRLIGIDSPETSHSDEQVRLQAQLSKRFAFYYLYRMHVTVEYDWEREDKYGRLLAYLWTEKNGLFNEFILEEGFASAYLRFPFKEEYRQKFIQAEKSARISNKGLWRKEPYPMVPLDKISDYIGQTAAVQYMCKDIQKKGQFFFLQSVGKRFSTLIPSNRVKLFEDVESIKGQTIQVQGFIEEYNGQPQIMAFFPRQIKAVEIAKKQSTKKEKQS